VADRLREASPSQEGHTILRRAGGPALLLLEEPVGSLLKKKEVEQLVTAEPEAKTNGSTPRSPEQAVYEGSRDDPALGPSQSKAKDHVRLRHVSGSFVGAAVPGGRGQVNENAASRRSAWGAGAELGFSASSVSSAGYGARHEPAPQVQCRGGTTGAQR